MRKSTRAPAANTAPAHQGNSKQLLNIFYDETAKELGLVSRDEHGVSVVKRTKPEWACFLRASDVSADLRRELGSSPAVTAIRVEGEHFRICWRNRYDLYRVAEKDGFFAERGIEVFEADVDPVRRYLTDNPVEIARPRRCYLDLEADNRVGLANKENARMLSWAIVDEASMARDRVRVLCPHDEERHACAECKESEEANARIEFVGRGGVAASAVLSEDTEEAEHELVEALLDALEPYDQVIAWNGGEMRPNGPGYDFPYLLARVRRLRVKRELRRVLWLDQLANFRRMNMSAAESGDEKQSLSLAAVSRSLLRLDKAKLGSGSDSWKMWCEDPDGLLRYNEQDARLQPLIERRTGFVDLLFVLCRATRTFPDSHGIKPTRQVEGAMLPLGREHGIRFATHYYDDGPREKFKGAHVEEPLSLGVVRDVHVCDFSGMYPSIMRSFNLSPETVRGRLPEPREGAPKPSYAAHKAAEKTGAVVQEGCAMVPPTRVVVAQEPPGVLVIALDRAVEMRAKAAKLKASLAPGTAEAIEATRQDSALKIFINSIYGVSGSPFSRFFVRDVAESTSLGGAWLIKETLAAASARGWTVIYGDTDSAFVTGCSDEEFVEFVAWCNTDLYPRLLREAGAARNYVALAYEKKFRRAVFVSKKHYAASFAHYKGTAATKKSRLEIKGLEYKRGDSSRLARRLQLEIVEAILREEIDDPGALEKILDRHRDHVLSGDLVIEDIVITKRLTKPINEYKQKTKKDNTPAARETHVTIAEVLAERGEDVREGTRIEFVVVDGSQTPIKAIPARDHDPSTDGKKADRFYLWEHLVFPPSQRVLAAAFPDHDWTRWERVRPPKPRRRGKPVPKEQEAFDFSPKR